MTSIISGYLCSRCGQPEHPGSACVEMPAPRRVLRPPYDEPYEILRTNAARVLDVLERSQERAESLVTLRTGQIDRVRAAIAVLDGGSVPAEMASNGSVPAPKKSRRAWTQAQKDAQSERLKAVHAAAKAAKAEA